MKPQNPTIGLLIQSPQGVSRCLTLLACGFAVATACRAQSLIPYDFPRVDWEPTVAPSGSAYAGAEACAGCHVTEAATGRTTPMNQALRRPDDSEVLRRYPLLTFQRGRYHYEIRREGGTSVYSVSDGRRTIVVPILAAVGYGLGGVAQTYLLEYKGFFFESEVTYYDRIHGLDVTLGHQNTTPAFLEGALGLRLSWYDQWLCLGCHSTGAVTSNQIQLDKMIPGVTCEGCHGPGAAHIAAVKSGQSRDLQIFNPAFLPPGDLNDFCGSCHRTTLAEKLLGVRGVQNVRFQGYRLARSRCYSPDDRRITCAACHDPHRPLVREAAFYDAKCLACHASSEAHVAANSSRSASPCPVAEHDCASCHMPKFEIPGSHYQFADHWIRVAKANSAYPE